MMNRRLVAGIAGLAMLLTACLATEDAYALGRKCGGSSSCGGDSSCGGGGLFSKLKASRCGGREKKERCGGGLFARLKAKKADCGCPQPEPCCAACSDML